MVCLITDALAPYFRKPLLKDFSDASYTLCSGETTNAASYEELQVAVRSLVTNKKHDCHQAHTDLFKKMHLATTKDIYSKLDEVLDLAKLPLSKLLMLSNYGLNVNKVDTKLMNYYLARETSCDKYCHL